jgi:chloramphenicol 3-O phosphotransferase
LKIQAIVLNGTSSSGKTSVAQELQGLLPGSWLTLGVDTFLTTLPPALRTSESGILFGSEGQVEVGEEFARLDRAWSLGVAAMVRAGAAVIVDEVFLGGHRSQDRWKSALAGLPVIWIGIRCSTEVAEARERGRTDRAAGMARIQADLVHAEVTYDLMVDTDTESPLECARKIAAFAL